MILVSVIMSVYNEPLEWIRQSIDSILAQTYREFEFIIINDNPTSQNVQNLLNKYSIIDKRIKILINQENLGLAESLNKGIKMAKGEYIARMDADDFSRPQRLEKQISYLKQHSNIALCGTWAKFFGEISILKTRKFKMPITCEAAEIQSIFASPLIHPSIMARANILRDNLYNPSLRKAQDFDLWSRLSCSGYKMASLPSYLIHYRITDKSLQSNVVSSQEAVAHQCRLRNLKNLGFKMSKQEAELHSEICCAVEGTDISKVESHLKKIKRFLIEKYPEEQSYINSIIGNYWSINCNVRNISFKCYRSSKLFWGFKWIDIIRLIKRSLI